jgi:hypothetical protein
MAEPTVCTFWYAATYAWTSSGITFEECGRYPATAGSGVIADLIAQKTKHRYLVSATVWRMDAETGVVSKDPCAMLNPDAKNAFSEAPKQLPVPVVQKSEAEPNTDVRLDLDAVAWAREIALPSASYPTVNFKEN